ncbi:PaaI family thioesterase [Alphaproteobacteria bacterium]|nr:PaaI family thioesterase [Alphaproteobacteria bacterium]
MNQLMTKEELNDFLEEEFPQVNKNFEILKVSNKKFSMLMHISREHLRPGATVSGPTMFLLADVTFYLATLSVIGPKSLTVTTNCSINFLRKPNEKNLISEARILKLGKTLSVGDVLIYSEDIDEPVAHASLTYSIPKN